MKQKLVRRGLGAIDLLVVIAIIAILIALLLPAVQGAREAAKRTMCFNNFKQLGLSLHNYHDTYKMFPAGHFSPPGDKQGLHISGLTSILPFLEQSALYDSVNFDLGVDSKANASAKTTQLKNYVCPSDAIAAGSKGATTNYFLSAGPGPSTLLEDNSNGNKLRGAFWQCSNMHIAKFIDGTSNSFITLESVVGDAKVKSWLRQHVRSADGLPNTVNVDAGDADFAAGNGLTSDRGDSWMNGKYLHSIMFASFAPNSSHVDITFKDDAGGVSGPRSSHAGGAVAGLGDGSVRFMANSTDPSIMVKMSTINGREEIQ